MEPRQLGARQEAAGRIVRVGEEDHARPLGHAAEQRIDVGAVVRVGRHHQRRAAAPRGDVVDREAIADVDHFVARPGEGLRGEIEQLVGAGAADDPRRIDAVQRAERRAQLGADSGSG